MEIVSAVRAQRRAPLLQPVKSAVAMLLSWFVAGWLVSGPPPVFAAIAGLLVVQPSVNQSFTKAIERSAGVVAGVAIASGLTLWLGTSTWVIVIAVLVALAVAWVLRLTAGVVNQVAVSALLVLAVGVADPAYAFDRIVETIIGAVIGVAVSILMVPAVLVEPARERVDALAAEIAASLERLADAVTREPTAVQLHGLLLEARLLVPMRDAARTALDAAADSLTMNPRARGRRPELEQLSARLDNLAPVVTQVIGMTRSLTEFDVTGLAAEPQAAAIAEQLLRAAHDVRPGSGIEADEPPALTTPLEIRTPSARNWVLMGSLLVDLRRIHEHVLASR
jgi:uncharacterized membrane protein YgaE (UPF0421/DUF939 family)